VKTNTLIVAIATVLLASSPATLACVINLPKPTVVRSHFDVLLQSRGRPILGMDVLVERYNLSEKWETVEEAVTDVGGRASFADLPAGNYVVGTHAASGNDGRRIQVTEDSRQKAAQQIDLVWPKKKVVVTRSLEGVFRSLSLDETPSEPLPAVKIEVLEAHSGHLEATLLTDEEGAFALQTLPPGMYFLKVSRENRNEDRRIWGWKLEGDIAVEVNPLRREAPEGMQVQLLMTDCGLFYKNAIK